MKLLLSPIHIVIIRKPVYWLMIAGMCITQQIAAQKNLTILTREIIVTRKDSVVRTNILVKNATLKGGENRTYYWYYDDDIKSNQGGHAGDLLHGPYVVFRSNNNMVTKGTFNYGLKDGDWKYWYNNGKLRLTESWKNGERYGTSKIYSREGDLLRTEDYKNGLLNGYVIVYNNGNIVEKNRYNKGIIQLPKHVEKDTVKEQNEHMKIKLPFGRKKEPEQQDVDQMQP